VDTQINKFTDRTLISLDEKDRIHHSEDLIKKLFYTCEKCDGVLVQLASCTDCKKTTLRICIRCDTVSETFHFPCIFAQNSKYFENLEMNI